ncbi:ATP-binding protein [Cohnella cellulosilytica]|uniref:histidine kinase n=2 Tax=Cohnella cellulosilytica TaxID=986710 RepID=A0ABW2FDM6_9BACL
MKAVRRLSGLGSFVLILFLFAVAPQLAHAEHRAVTIQQWQISFIQKTDVSESPPLNDAAWQDAGVRDPLTILPDGARGVWIRLALPPTVDWANPGLLADRLYGHDLAVYRGSELLLRLERNFAFDLNKLILPIGAVDHQTDLYIRILTSGERAGLLTGMRLDDFHALSERFVSRDIPDLLLGSGIAFLGLVMLICTGYLHRRQRGTWISLCLIALTTGLLMVFYSPLPYIYFKDYGQLLLFLFDASMFVLFPSLNYYVDQMFDGQFRFFTRFRYFQAGYSGLCMCALVVYAVTDERYYAPYHLVSNLIFGVIILVQLVLIVVLSVSHAFKGNKDATLLSIGMFLLALLGTTDLALYYLSGKTYVLFLWKFGVIALMITLIVILARRISADYAMLVNYSKELELYNHRLERTEKLKIISDLAASVAHEVRNPLQVTRGFLQLLAGKSDEKNKPFFDLATNELDRASAIITDFLTFAKPEMETVSLLNLSEELRKIETMMTPLAAMHDTELLFISEPELYFQGNSSKLKQAFINVIKNSLEATGTNGRIEVTAIAENNEVVIRVKDNGEGMEEEQIAKLGVPFFSTKAKGTGLGLMVTFRIIEVMKGTIEFRSVKKQGTEAIIRFPLASTEEGSGALSGAGA